MYAIVKYYNYRKENELKVLELTHEKDIAIQKAYEYAVKEYGEIEVVDTVEEQWFYLHDAIIEYTTGDGFGAYVFAVIQLPNPN